MADVRIVQGGQNQGPITAAHVKALERANALVVVQVNASGDIVNPGGSGGAGSDVNVSQINSQTPDMNIGNASAGTLRVVLASDQPTVSVSGSFAASQVPVTGVQIVGGSVGGKFSTSGDIGVIPSSTNSTRFPVSGDNGISDGVDRTILATVKDYPNSNPLTVVLVNPSGDAYIPIPEKPILVTRSGRITSSGTIVIAGPYNGRVIKVSRYELQSEADTAQCRFGSNASGEALTNQWLLNSREGVVEAVSPLGGGYVFKTQLNQSLVIESAGNNFRYSVSFHSGDSI